MHATLNSMARSDLVYCVITICLKTHGMPFCRSRSSFGIVMTYRCHWRLSSKSWVGAFMQCKGQPLPLHCIRRESVHFIDLYHVSVNIFLGVTLWSHQLYIGILYNHYVCTVFLHHFRKMVLITSSYMYTPPLNIHVCVYPISLHLCLVVQSRGWCQGLLLYL